MQWTVEHHKHYSTEHLQKANKQQVMAELAQKSAYPKGILGKRRNSRPIL